MSYREAPIVHRTRLRDRIRKLLASRFMLRAHMSLIVLLTSGAAFFTSYALRMMGVDSMAWRYAAATTVAYASFLGLFHLWLWYFRRDLDHELRPDTEALAGTARPPSASAPARSDGDVYDNADVLDPGLSAVDVSSAGDVAEGAGSSLGGIDGEGAVVVVVIALALIALAVLGVGAWIIWEAPVLFGEALFDVVLSAALARSRREVTGEGDARGVFRATWWVFPLVLLVVTIGGFASQHACPGATTMGQAVHLCVLQ